MDITITPGKLRGEIQVIPSKSQAHRYLICAALSKGHTTLLCPETNRDIEATVDCLNALGAHIQRTENGYGIDPLSTIPQAATLNCCESGSTLRFMLPIAGALGVDATFRMAGRLPQRPLSPLWEEMERMGCTLTRPTPDTIRCQGKLQPGAYTMDGSVSSQYITGLLFALSLLENSELTITGKVESKPYIEMTQRAMKLFSAPNYRSPGVVTVEGDWSNGAFWLAANALGSHATVTNLDENSPQGDRKAAVLLQNLKDFINIDVSDIPDLVPILSVVASCNKGAKFQNIQRLRLKESDRVASTIAMLQAMGGKAEATDETITVYGTGLRGGTMDACNDHRIAMSAAIAATVCTEPVTILGAECVQKSYPRFWEEYNRLSCHCEPVRRLVWQSPITSNQPNIPGDSHASVIYSSE